MPVPFWARPTHVALLISAYLLVHFAVRMAMWPTLGLDDAEQALFAQQFSWTYRYRAPPLFTWALVAVGQGIGINIVSISLIRYALLGITFGFIYLTARRLIADPRLAALSVYSFVAIYVFAYYSHHDLTHTTSLAAMAALAWYVFVRLAESPTLGWYLALGVVLGLGLLAKWNFVMLASALPLACLLRSPFRRLVLTWKIVPSALVTALVVLPTVVAVLRMGPGPGEDVGTVLGSQDAPLLSRIGEGTLELLAAVIGYPQPLLPLLLLFFAIPLWRGLRSSALPQPSPPRPDAALLGWTIAISVALHWALVLIVGATEFSERLMQPPLLILPVWAFMLIERGTPSARTINVFALILASIAMAALAGRVTVYLRGAEHCGTCRAMVPFPQLSQQLQAAGFRGTGTILAPGFHLGGNLRVAFPEARVIDIDYPASRWPAPAAQGQCLLVWQGAENSSEPRGAPGPMQSYLADQLRGDPSAPYRDGTAAAPMLNSSREYRLGFRLYEQPAGDCR